MATPKASGKRASQPKPRIKVGGTSASYLPTKKPRRQGNKGGR